MAETGLTDLLTAGVHFGHQTRRWNPKMRRFIHGERAGLYLIDLLQTEKLLATAQAFASETAGRGGTILFVGTKKQARDAVREAAQGCGMPYVDQRWLGGLLTNFQTMSKRIKRLNDLERYEAEGQLELLPPQERISLRKDLAKLQINLGGVKDMKRAPDALFVVDLKTEAIALKEAQRLRIPIIGLTDTNVDPDGIDYVVPGNDDAIRSCALIAHAIGDAASSGSVEWRAAEEERKRREAEDRERRQAEDAARREQEEQARQEAEDAAAASAQIQVEAQEAEEAEEAARQQQTAAASAEAPTPDPSKEAPAA